jgi:AcrR family transcriptional regulator
MRKRAEQVEETRQRIVDATITLHTTVGPANTTITGVAEQAGVTRLTVYRHFPDLESLFAACGRRWTELHPPPDPAPWRKIADIEARSQHALAELYDWYQACGDELLPIMRDREAMPASTQQELGDTFQAFAEALVAGSGVRGHARRRLNATAGLVVGFWTWHSLTIEQDLDIDEAVDLAVNLFLDAAQPHDPP